MQVNDYLIPQIFTKGTLVIPFFQRACVWTEGNWKRFFDDIAQLAATPLDERRVYFLGSIILHKDKNQVRFDVIDGQQRLTTIVMFMKMLYLMTAQEATFNAFFTQPDANGNVTPKLVPSSNDKATYDVIVLYLDTADANYNAKHQGRLAECFSYFVKRMLEAQDPEKGIDEDHTTISAREILNCVNQYVHIVGIDVEDTEDSQVIFETINSSGVRLTTGELLKNYLFRGETDYQRYQNGWQRTFEQLNLKYWEGEQTSGRISKGQIENFLYQFMLVKMQDPEIKPRLTRTRIKQYRKTSGLYDHYHSMVEELNLDKLQLADEIADSANTYHDIFNESLLDNALTAIPGRTRLAALMSMGDTYTMVPYILYVERNVSEKQEREDIYSYIETYLLRRIICKSKNNNYSDMFSENLIGSGIKTAQQFMDYVNDANARGALLMPSDDDVRKALRENNLASSARMLLYLIETKVNSNFTGQTPDVNGYEKLQADALMPTKHFLDNTNWPMVDNYNEDQRTTLVNTLGNFALMRDGKLKSSQASKEWLAKRVEMAKQIKDLTTSEFISDAALWDESTIEQRNDKLADLVIQYWPKNVVNYIAPEWGVPTQPVVSAPQTPVAQPTSPSQPIVSSQRNMRRYGMRATVGEDLKNYENVYIDDKVELFDTLDGWFDKFLSEQNRNGLFRKEHIQYVLDDDDVKYGYIYLRNGNVLPFIAKYQGDSDTGTRYRIFLFNMMKPQQVEDSPIDFEEEINTLACESLWE